MSCIINDYANILYFESSPKKIAFVTLECIGLIVRCTKESR